MKRGLGTSSIQSRSGPVREPCPTTLHKLIIWHNAKNCQRPARLKLHLPLGTLCEQAGNNQSARLLTFIILLESASGNSQCKLRKTDVNASRFIFKSILRMNMMYTTMCNVFGFEYSKGRYCGDWLGTLLDKTYTPFCPAEKNSF